MPWWAVDAGSREKVYIDSSGGAEISRQGIFALSVSQLFVDMIFNIYRNIIFCSIWIVEF